jgi:hypothetical protein
MNNQSKEIYLVQSISQIGGGDNLTSSETIGSATKKQIYDNRYILKLLTNRNFNFSKIVAFPLKPVKSSNLRYYMGNETGELGNIPGLVTLFDENEYPLDEGEDGYIYPLKKRIKELQLMSLPSYVASKRATKSIFKQKNLPEDMQRNIGKYLAFGNKRKNQSKKKKVLTKALKNQAKKYKIRLTLKRGNKRVYKSEKTLKKQIKNKKL